VLLLLLLARTLLTPDAICKHHLSSGICVANGSQPIFLRGLFQCSFQAGFLAKHNYQLLDNDVENTSPGERITAMELPIRRKPL